MLLKTRFLLIVFCALLSVKSVFTQKKVKNVRSLYVDNFSNILGSSNKEKELFEFAAKHQIKRLILYDLNKIKKYFDGDSSIVQILANFVRKAKANHGLKISASGESGDFFINAIHVYNKNRKDKLERFDIYNLEYEYWDPKASSEGGYYCETYLKRGQLKCNRKDSFKYYVQSLQVMRLLANELDSTIQVEAYIGKFTKEEGKKLSTNVDHLLIHDYVAYEERFLPYVMDRLQIMSDINSKVKLSILYSTESRYLGKYLKDHDFYEAEEKFIEDIKKQDIDLARNLNWMGFAYYNYGYFKFVESRKRNR